MDLKYSYGFFHTNGGYWGVYPISARTIYGTVDEDQVISAHGSAQDAEAALAKSQQTGIDDET